MLTIKVKPWLEWLCKKDVSRGAQRREQFERALEYNRKLFAKERWAIIKLYLKMFPTMHNRIDKIPDETLINYWCINLIKKAQ